ncbi:MAG: hypothetical protein GY798_03705, partial [Hyphomicrobiales bacterium]|nr:hypothetical protein [Hyphomicrobiales bacterium]
EDADTGDVLTFSIKDSDDGAFFDVDPVTGVVSFKSAPDFETPADGDGDNQYIVVVEVSDGTDTDAVEFGVTVTDIAALNLVGTKNKDTLIGGDEGDVIKGKNGKDTLKGLGGDDELNGGKGKDKMIGGDGKDGFVFADKLKSSNVDKVKDFAVNVDRIHLNDKIFTKIGNEGGLKGKYFEKGKKADDGKDRIIYDKKTGNLFYDKDGKGGKDQVKFAQLDKKLKLDADDFLVV